jgi:hypothetical protein
MNPTIKLWVPQNKMCGSHLMWVPYEYLMNPCGSRTWVPPKHIVGPAWNSTCGWTEPSTHDTTTLVLLMTWLNVGAKIPHFRSCKDRLGNVNCWITSYVLPSELEISPFSISRTFSIQLLEALLIWTCCAVIYLTTILVFFLLGVTRKIRMIHLTRERVLNTFKHKVRAPRDSDSRSWLHKFQKSESVYTCPRAPFYREMKGLLYS